MAEQLQPGADSPETRSARARSDLGDSAARGTGITLLVQALRTILQFGSIVVLARLLSPRDFGLVAEVTAVIGVADLVRDLGLSLAAIQSPTLSRAERSNLFWANLAFGGVCTLGAVAATPLIVLGYGEPRLGPVVLSLACVFVLSGFTTQFRAGLARDMRFKAIGASDVTAQTLSISVAVVLAAEGFGLWALVVQQLVNAVTSAVMCVRFAGWWPGRPDRDVSIRRFMRFGIGIFGAQGIAYATKNVDNIAIGAVWGASPLGFYSRAYQLMMMPLAQINAPLTQVATPVLSRVQADGAVFLAYLKKAQLVACYATATVFAVAAGLSEPLVHVLFGPRWTAVVPIFAILAVCGIFRAIAQVAYWAYLARGESAALFRQQAVTGVVTILAIFAGLPWGPRGVAVGCTVAACFSWAFALWHVGRVTRIDTLPLITNAVRIVALVGLPSGAVAYVTTWLPIPDIAQMLAAGVSVSAYLALAFVTVPSVRADLRIVLSFGRRAITRRRPQAVPVDAVVVGDSRPS